MLMQAMKKIDHTMNEKEMLQFVKGLVWAYDPEGNTLPDYFGKILQISDNNSKTGYGTLNLPALVTCLIGIECNKVCYACHGRFVMDSVEVPRISNLLLWLTDPESYENQLRLQMRTRRILRINDSGDMPSYEYLHMIYTLSIETGCMIHLYTKKYHLINRLCKEYGENAHTLENKGIIVLMSTDPALKMINPYGMRITTIIPDTKEIYNGMRIDKTHICKHGSCMDCLMHGVGCFAGVDNVNNIALAIHAATKAESAAYFEKGL